MRFNKKFKLIVIISILSTLLFSTFVLAADAQNGNADEVFQAVVNTPAAAEKGLVIHNGDIYYRTSDTQATTNITYATIGLVISDRNNPSNGVVIDGKDMSEPASILVPGPNGVGQVYAQARKIGSLADFATQLGTMSLRMDCIMETRVNGVSEPEYYTDASVMALVASAYGVSLSEVKTSQDLIDKYGWKDPSGIMSHFDWVLELVGLGYSEEQIKDIIENEIVDPEEPDKVVGSTDDENVIASCGGHDHDETPSAEYRTGTESTGNNYCIFEGIPSGKHLNNYYTADTWRAGTYAFAVNQARPFSYSVTYLYEKYVVVGTKNVPQPDGSTKEEDIIELRKFSQSQAYAGVVASSYTYLRNPSVYASFTGTVSNKAFDSDKVYSGPSGSGNFTASGHLTFKTPGGLPEAVQDLGLNGDEKIPELILLDGKQTYAAYKSDGVESQNDNWEFTVDGESHRMLDGGGVSTIGYVVGNAMWDPDATSMPSKFSHEMLPGSASVMYHYAKGDSYLSSINPHDSAIDSKMDFPIPTNTDNGRYNTTVSLDFSLVGSASAGDNWGHNFSTSSPYSGHTISSYNPGTQCTTHGGCKRDTSYDSLYPVEVHTPVHSPVQILDGNGTLLTGNPKTNYENASSNTSMPSGVTGNKGNNQLVKEADGVDYALSLDHWYAIRWDWFNHRQIQGYYDSENSWDGTNDTKRDTPSKYDEFVAKKTMKFPFEVMYNGKFYAANEEIVVSEPSDKNRNANYKLNKELREYESDNHWVVAPIYIPSYAREIKGDIVYKVTAYNADARYTGDHFSDEEVEGNITYKYEEIGNETGKGAKYVATYTIPVETYGIIYDFTIVGTSDTEVHEYNGGRTSNISTDFNVPFALYKEEKKVGTKNRLGGNSLRYLLDGEVTKNWNPKNTLVLEDGKSNLWSNMGSVVKGTKFSFTVKTIANLWGANDHVAITPTFRYINSNGKVITNDNLIIYYNSPSSEDIFIRLGGNRDTNNKNIQYVKIGDPQFEGSYYSENMAGGEVNSNPYHFGNWPKYTAEKENEWTGSNIDGEDVLNRKTPSYCMSSIDLKSTQRLLSGEYEQLEWNIDSDAYTQDSYGHTLKRYNDLKMVGDANINTSTNETRNIRDLMRYSMQTWYGQYYIPSDLYIVDLTKHPNFDLAEYIKDNGGEIQYNDPVFEKNGSLVVNFDIKTYKTPKDFNTGKETSTTATPHLKYYGGAGGKNMWQTEGFENTPGKYVTTDYPDIKDDPTAPHTPTPDKYEDGDVIIVDLTQSVKDRYESGLFNIN